MKEKLTNLGVSSYVYEELISTDPATLSNLELNWDIVSKNIKGTIYYRVVVGTFEKEKNAEALQEKYEDLGYDVFIDTYYQ